MPFCKKRYEAIYSCVPLSHEPFFEPFSPFVIFWIGSFSAGGFSTTSSAPNCWQQPEKIGHWLHQDSRIPFRQHLNNKKDSCYWNNFI
jgi:hypothetical protein